MWYLRRRRLRQEIRDMEDLHAEQAVQQTLNANGGGYVRMPNGKVLTAEDIYGVKPVDKMTLHELEHDTYGGKIEPLVPLGGHDPSEVCGICNRHRREEASDVGMYQTLPPGLTDEALLARMRAPRKML